MVDYRDDWKYSKPIPKEPTRRAYEEGWERVFGKKASITPLDCTGDFHLQTLFLEAQERKP